MMHDGLPDERRRDKESAGAGAVYVAIVQLNFVFTVKRLHQGQVWERLSVAKTFTRNAFKPAMDAVVDSDVGHNAPSDLGLLIELYHIIGEKSIDIRKIV